MPPSVLSDAARAELDRLDRLVGRRRDREALPGLAALAAQHPDHPIVVFLYAKALRRLGEPARAGEVVARAARLTPDDPHIGLGLAWSALDVGDLPRAVALSTPAREVPALRGDALAIAGREREASGDLEAARALYLESYVARPMLDVLGACEHLSLGETRDPRARRAPWPIGVVHRRWLFRVVEHELAARARARFGELPADRLLPAGCDHGAPLTARWAEAARVDRLALFRALSDRGGFCDCEVVLNAAREDDEDAEVLLVAGRVSGRLPTAVGELFEAGEAPRPHLTDGPAADREQPTTRDQSFLTAPQRTGRAVAPQLVTDALVSDLTTAWSAAEAERARIELLVVAPDLRDADGVPATELAVLGGGGRIDAAPIARPVSPMLAEAMPWLPGALATLDAALPPPSAPATGRWALGDPSTPRLLVRGPEGGLVIGPAAASERLAVPGTLVLSPDGARAAWLEARRTRAELWLEERASGERRVLATARFRGRPAFDAEGGALLVVVDEDVVSIDVRTGARRVLAIGDALAVSPTGVVAVERKLTGQIVLLGRDGRALAAPFPGQAPVMSPRGDRLAYLDRAEVRPEHTSYQAHVLELGSGTHRRVGPDYQEACWTSFADGGRALVMHARLARRWVPLGDGRARLEENERLLLVDLERDATRVLHATDGGSLRIVAPLSHPRLPLVAFRTQDAPRVAQRLVVVSTTTEAPPTTLVDAPLTPVAWLW